MMKCAFLIFICLTFRPIFSQHSPVFPQPNILAETADTYRLTGSIRYVENPEVREVLPVIAQQYNAFHGLTWNRVEDGASKDIVFSRQSDLDKEAYGLVINNNGILVTYGSTSGLLYALQTLDQWMTGQTGKEIVVPGVRIEDAPAFAYRGVQLDCARHFFTIPELKEFIDQAARLKLNTFHWHLTDDQGWRIEIKRYPKLTAVGAWRDSTMIGHDRHIPRTYDNKRYGGFYTQEEAKELVRYAAVRGITIIPEIELPGHARAALAAYPELSCTGEQLPVPGEWGIFEAIFCSKPETIDFLQNVLEEVIAIFPSETIHIGGDEAPKNRWDVCPQCKEVMELNGLHDSQELQSYVIREMEVFLNARGRKLIGWDEILDGGLADNAQVMSWRGTEGGIAAAKAHHAVVMSPTAFCYFDYYQSLYPDEPLAIGGFVPLEKVYQFNPIPAALTAEEQRYILGGQANLWTEYLPDMKAVYYSMFPRLIAMSEVLWTKKHPAYAAFVEAMTINYLPRLAIAGINYSTAFLDPKITAIAQKDGIAYQLLTHLPAVTYTVNGIAAEKITLEQTSDPHELKTTVVANYIGKPLRELHYTFFTHELVGKYVHFSTLPHRKYRNNDSLALTDGVRGVRPWKGDQWLGFVNDTVQFSIDLGAKTKFSSVELGCLHHPGSWIYMPKTILVEVSNNGKSYKPLKRQAVTTESIVVAAKANARFVRITLLNDERISDGQPGAGTTPWTFIDELMIH